VQKIEVIDLGSMDYRSAWDFQTHEMELLKEERRNGVSSLPYRLLFVQHPHVYTLGKSGHLSNMLASDVEIVHVDRGGDITYHGPGQWVVYPIFRLDTLGIGIKEYMCRLEEAIIQTVAEYGIKGERLEKCTGVWIDTLTKPRKICAMGVRCSEQVTMHGLAINVNTDLLYFQKINPCGFTDKGVTSMQKELGGAALDMNEVKHSLIKNFYKIFDFESSV
jgi:lipoyl(octanoyl) transferase